jgi:dynactin-5
MCAKHGLHANDDSRSYFSNWELVAHTLQDSGNKVSRRSAITGTANITLGGRTVIMADVQLRGDLHPTRAVPSSSASGKEVTPTSISIGRCTVISTASVIKPPCRMSRGQMHYYPMKIGDNVFVGKSLLGAACDIISTDCISGPNCTIQAISIASHVHIGENVTINQFVIIKENVKVLPNTAVPANMVIASGSVVGGQPAKVIGEVGEGWGVSGSGGGLGVGGGGEEKWVEGGDLRELVRSIK